MVTLQNLKRKPFNSPPLTDDDKDASPLLSEKEESPSTYQPEPRSDSQNEQTHCHKRRPVYSWWLHVVVPIVSLTALILMFVACTEPRRVSIHTKDPMKNINKIAVEAPGVPPGFTFENQVITILTNFSCVEKHINLSEAANSKTPPKEEIELLKFKAGLLRAKGEELILQAQFCPELDLQNLSRIFTFNGECSRKDIISIGNTIGNSEGLILATSGIKIGLLIGIAIISADPANAKNNRIVGTMGYLILSIGYLVIEILMLAMYDKTAAQFLSMSTVCLQPNIIFSILRTRSRHLVLAATVLDCFLVFSNLIYFCQAVKIRFKKSNLDEVN